MSETGTSVPGPRAADSTVLVDPAESAWAEYVAAARQLDGVRRSAATAAGEQARSVAAAREELTAVRERLAPQQSRLRELGVPAIALAPTPPEVTEAARSMAGGPTAVLAALRSAGAWADAADDTLAARGLPQLARWPARPRNLLVYGPLALVVPLLQLGLHAVAGAGPVTMLALVVGLPLPAVAFMLGWLAVGRFFRPRPADRVDRTPRFGALVCLIPAVLTAAGLLLAMLSG
ncbi:hypothetical protein [Micromonospora sp. NBS 11-29]|uniref:hypothetical protein n=1 Tax=Micromonospora sp. NBS 11-29 TaxID=1960879 RepID=UPI000B7707A9|nr:hypothetical protein [Micromonospora sp. NBS 11-29]